MLLADDVMDTRLSDAPPDASSIPTGRGYLRPYAVLATQISDGAGKAVPDIQVQLVNHKTKNIVQQLPTDLSGRIFFAFDRPNADLFVIRPIAPAGFGFSPPEIKSGKVGDQVFYVWAKPLVASSAEPDKPVWNPETDIYSFTMEKAAARGALDFLTNPWVIGGLAVGGLFLYANFRGR